MFIKIVLVVFVIGVSGESYKLKQVLMLSRHNVRTPLSKTLNNYTPRQWPHWKEKRGYLTEKGAQLEGYLGEFIASWLQKEGLLSEHCPNNEDFFVYANTAQRTMASAYAFVSKAYPACNVTINHTSDESDQMFNPFIHNDTAIFKIKALEQMQILLKSLHKNDSYENLDKILNYKESEKCLKECKCDLINDKNRIYIALGTKPNVEGPLKISKSVIDSFIMENYEGFPLIDVAWGELLNSIQWNKIVELSRGYHNVVFNITMIAKDIARPLLDYMADIILNDKHKVTLLMGHDANIYTILKSMSFKPYNLQNQYEKAPAGGKLMFQKWLDEDSNVSYLKIDYIYQTTEQMRRGTKLSVENPPMLTSLELDDCKIHDNGMCLWDDFTEFLRNL